MDGKSLPKVVAHADWSKDPRKRWFSLSTLRADQTYLVDAPEQVGELETFLRRLQTRAVGDAVLVGFDFPIGLPAKYAELAGLSHFLQALPGFGRGSWLRFYDIAETRSEISLQRPFYPYRPGGTKQSHLLEALGVTDIDALRRICDRKTPSRGPASPLFWTLGAQQVGRAAIIGWRDLLSPALSDEQFDVKIWPFDGELDELIKPERLVIVETYPAEACLHVGISPPGRDWSKRSQTDRRRQAEPLSSWAHSRAVNWTGTLEHAVTCGFGGSRDGEDRFDSVIGLFSMLEVVLGHRASGVPAQRSIRTVEGWIFGQAGEVPIASGSVEERATELLSRLIDRANKGDAQICTYSWAYRYIFDTTYEMWSQAYANQVIQVAERTPLMNLPGLGAVRLDAFIVAITTGRPSSGHWESANYYPEDWDRVLGTATILH